MRIAVKNSDGRNILDCLRDNNIYLPAVCGGRGVCGKCGVNIITDANFGGEPAVCGDENRIKNRIALPRKVLACQTPAADGMVVEIPDEGGMQIVDAYSPQRVTVCDNGGGYGLAIDIGTTTLAAELIDRVSGNRIASYSAVNRQRAFGADVISRISQAVGGKLPEFHNYIIADINNIIDKLTVVSRASRDESASGGAAEFPRIEAVTIAGNTTMLHLLRGYHCDTLGVYPFTPVSVAMEKYIREGREVTVLPGASAFIGSDVMAGIIFCGEPSGEGFNLLIDLGTNCETALYSKTTVLAASAAAGPVFEGGNISCGTGSVPGAVASVVYLPNERVYAYKTIGNQAPSGICGTGAVDAAAQFFIHGIIDETGLLCDDFFETGVEIAPGVVFTQKDIREIQLAKSAVRSGIEILLAEAGAGYDSVERVLLAGGFGQKINIESACVLGIIPYELKNKVTAVGNSALGGAARVLLNRRAGEEIRAAAARTREIVLSSHPMFNDLFMEHMAFSTRPAREAESIVRK